MRAAALSSLLCALSCSSLPGPAAPPELRGRTQLLGTVPEGMSFAISTLDDEAAARRWLAQGAIQDPALAARVEALIESTDFSRYRLLFQADYAPQVPDGYGIRGDAIEIVFPSSCMGGAKPNSILVALQIPRSPEKVESYYTGGPCPGNLP